jgi:hypothetical protein
VLTEVLGGNGTRNYLVEQVDPAELRAGGGFIGTYTVLQADQGSMKVTHSGDAVDLINPRPHAGDAGFIPLPTAYRDVIPWVGWTFIDSNVYPDFPANARAAQNFVEPRIGKVDGVISIDYFAVSRMLALTGPLPVPGFEAVDSNNFIPTVMKGELLGAADRKAIASALAGPLMSRISAFPADQWPALLQALNELAAARHVQAYFSNDTVEGELHRVGWSGILNPASSNEFMMEVEDNYFGNKVNYFLGRHFTVELSRRGDLLHHAVTVDLINQEPYGLEGRSSYRASFRFFVADQAMSLSDNLRAVKYPNPSPPPGLRLTDGWLPDIPCCGGRGRAVFEFDTPWPTRGRGNVQIYWQKQPGSTADGADIGWDDGNGHRFTATTQLDQDLLVKLTAAGITVQPGHPGQARLPTLSLE